MENSGYIRRQELTCTLEELSQYGDVILHKNEVLYVIQNDGTRDMKMGDGMTRVADLPYVVRYTDIKNFKEEAEQSAKEAENYAREAEIAAEPNNSKFSNSVKKTIRGKSIYANDISTNQHTIKVNVICPEGVDPTTVKVTSCGKNLIRNYAYKSFNYNGISAVENEDGSIILNGTATASFNYMIIATDNNYGQTDGSFPLESGQYVFSMGTTMPNGVRFRLVHGEQITELVKPQYGKNYDILFVEDRLESVIWQLQILVGTVLDNFIIYPQVERGCVPTAFEKPNFQTVTPNADGTVAGLNSVPSITNIYTDTANVVIEAEYVVATKDVENYIDPLTKYVKATTVYCEDLSPVKHKVKATVSGVDDLSSVRVRRVGTNLIPFPYSEMLYDKNGIKISADESGVITVNGTSTVTTEAFLRLKDIDKYNFFVDSDLTISLGGAVEGINLNFAMTSGNSASNFTTPGIHFARMVKHISLAVKPGYTYDNVKVYPMINVGSEVKPFEKGCYMDYPVNADGTVDGVESIDNMSLLTVYPDSNPNDEDYANPKVAVLEVEYQKDINTAITGFPYADYNLPVVYLDGNIAGMNKDNKVNLAYRYGDRVGTCTLKWQGSSSISYPKKNYTIVFKDGFEGEDGFEVKEGWGKHTKYCLKANWIDFSHSRNIVSARLWSQMVKERLETSEDTGIVSHLQQSPNYGAVDGFPCFVVINGEWQGVYTFNIPKEGYMFGMGSGTKEAILCANQTGNDGTYNGVQFKGPADTKCLEVEYQSEGFTDEEIMTSVNRLINACINSDGTDIDTTIAQYLDINSAIDYFILANLTNHFDGINKNYLLATYDGTKWFFSAYDLDSTWGLHWNGGSFLGSGYDEGSNNMSYKTTAKWHRLFELLYKYKKSDVIKRYRQLRGKVFSVHNVVRHFYNYAGQFPLTTLSADAELWKIIPSTTTNNVSQIAMWYQDRVLHTDAEIQSMQEELDETDSDIDIEGNVYVSGKRWFNANAIRELGTDATYTFEREYVNIVSNNGEQFMAIKCTVNQCYLYKDVNGTLTRRYVHNNQRFNDLNWSDCTLDFGDIPQKVSLEFKEWLDYYTEDYNPYTLAEGYYYYNNNAKSELGATVGSAKYYFSAQPINFKVYRGNSYTKIEQFNETNGNITRYYTSADTAIDVHKNGFDTSVEGIPLQLSDQQVSMELYVWFIYYTRYSRWSPIS